MNELSRSERYAKMATRHGYYRRELRATTEHCMTMYRYWRSREYEICSEWSDDLFCMVDYVFRELGARESHLMLALDDEAKPVEPGNLSWVLRRRRQFSRKLRGRLGPEGMAREMAKYRRVDGVLEYRDPSAPETILDLGPELEPDCLGDERCQATCALGTPCAWLDNVRGRALFDR